MTFLSVINSYGDEQYQLQVYKHSILYWIWLLLFTTPIFVRILGDSDRTPGTVHDV